MSDTVARRFKKGQPVAVRLDALSYQGYFGNISGYTHDGRVIVDLFLKPGMVLSFDESELE